MSHLSDKFFDYLQSNKTDNEIIGFIISKNISDDLLSNMFYQYIHNRRVNLAKYTIDRLGIENLKGAHMKFRDAAYYGCCGIVEEMIKYNYITNDENILSCAMAVSKSRCHTEVYELLLEHTKVELRKKKLNQLFNGGKKIK